MENPNKKKLGERVVDNLQKIILVFLAIIYILQGCFKFEETGATILEILGNIGFTVVLGVLVTAQFQSMGLQAGRKDSSYIESNKLYGVTKEKATPYFHHLPAWCSYKDAQELEFQKKEIIESEGLSWKAYKLGYYKTHTDKLSEEQRLALKKADVCKIIRLKCNELLSDLPNSHFKQKHKFGKDVREYSAENTALDLFSKIAIGVLCGMYSLQPLQEEDPSLILAGILWNLLQVIIWIIFGLIKYYKFKNFIINEYRQTHIIQKTEYLNEFIVTVEKNLSVIYKYEEDDDLEQYIQDLQSKKEAVNEQ